MSEISDWKLIAAILGSSLSAFVAWIKFFEDNWRNRTLRLYSSLVELGLASEEERKTFDFLAEEERFRLVFGRPSTPQYRKLVWHAYRQGYFSRNQFLISGEYFTLSDEGRLVIELGGLEKFYIILSVVGILILAISIYYFTATLTHIGSVSAYLFLVAVIVVLMPALLYFFRSAIGFAVAKRIKSKRVDQMEPELDDLSERGARTFSSHAERNVKTNS